MSGWLAKKISTHYIIAVVHGARRLEAPARSFEAPARSFEAPARSFEAPARSFEAPARPDRVDSDGTPRFIAEKLDQAAWG